MVLAVREDGSPDWEEIEEEIRCPLCEYQLRGLIEPRCPECGYRFDWPDLLDPTRRLHPYLFEHHPERNGESFRRTLLGGFRPRRFWTSLHPVQPSCLRRLVLYWCLAAVPIVAVPLVITILLVAAVARHNAVRRPAIAADPRRFIAEEYLDSGIAELGSVQAFLDDVFPTGIMDIMSGMMEEWVTVAQLVLPYVVVLTWPWLTFLSLMIFAIPMQQAKVNRTHVLRSVLYSFDVVLWIGLGQLLMIFLSRLASSAWPIVQLYIGPWAAVPLAVGPWAGVSLIVGPGVFVIFSALLLVFGSFRLWTAYRHYLRFRHPFATVLASQIIVFLIALNLLFFVTIY
jgi:rubredoxin